MYNHNFNSWYMEDSFKEFGLFLDQISYWLTCLYDRLWNVHTICCHYHFLTLTIQDMHSIKHIWLILQWPVLPWASYQTRTIGIAHAPGIPGTFSPPRLHRKPLVSDPGMHHGTCVSHVPWCMSGLLTRYGGKKRSRHSRRMRNPQLYVSGKRAMGVVTAAAETARFMGGIYHGSVNLCCVKLWW